jgi:hypothetical protein
VGGKKATALGLPGGGELGEVVTLKLCSSDSLILLNLFSFIISTSFAGMQAMPPKEV